MVYVIVRLLYVSNDIVCMTENPHILSTLAHQLAITNGMNLVTVACLPFIVCGTINVSE